MNDTHARVEIDFSERSAFERYHFMISAIVPRPIAWVSTLGLDGTTNLAPFSFFQGVSADPPVLMIAFAGSKRSGERKDTLSNIEATGEFVVNVVNEDQVDAMVLSSVEYPRSTSEIDLAGMATFPARTVQAPCLEASPVNMECRVVRKLEIGQGVAVFGEILLVHARRDVINERGTVDPDRLRPLARLGGSLYARYGGAFSRRAPGRGG